MRAPAAKPTVTPLRGGRWAARIAALLVSCGLVVGAAEIALRAGVARPAFRYPFGLDFAIFLDRRRLYELVPRSGSEINRQGYRDAQFRNRPVTGPRVVFLGDSYVMGLTTPSAQTIPNQLESLLGDADVLNMGVFGYGPDQSLIQLRDEALGYAPDVVVLAVMPANDFADIEKNHLFELDPDGRLRETTSNAVTAVFPRWELGYVCDFHRFKRFGRPDYFSELFRLLHHDGLDLDPYDPGRAAVVKHKEALMRGVLGAMRDDLRSRDIRFVVVSIPHGPATGRHNPALEGQLPFLNEFLLRRIATGLGLEFLDMVPLLGRSPDNEALYVQDPSGEHLNRAGHERVAKAIAAQLGSPRPSP